MESTTKERGKFSKIPYLLFRYIALKVYTKQGNVQGMYRNLQKLKPIYKNNPKYYLRLSKLEAQQNYWNKSLKNINDAIQLSSEPSATKLYLNKANILIQLNDSSKAIDFLNKYLTKHPDDLYACRILANEQKRIGQYDAAIDGFISYLKSEPNDTISIFQLAECYRAVDDTNNAMNHYKQFIDEYSPNLDYNKLITSYYWLGCMQLNNNPDQATKSFEKVVQLDDKLESQRLGIGVFHEKYGQLNLAVDAYKKQLQKDKKNAGLYFKLASLLDKKLYRPEKALKYYETALELNKVRSPWHFALANCYEQLSDYQNAAKWFKSAIARQEKHRPGNYRRLGAVLDRLGKKEDALLSYKEAELFSRPNFVGEAFYKKYINKTNVRYAISYDHYKVDDKMIFYESLSGARMMDSPFAIFEYIFNKEDFNDYTHVWVVNSFHVIPIEYRSADNIIFIKRRSDAYYKYISMSKYLICNSTFDPYVVRKPNQLYLQTSHGIFYKTVGRDSAGTPLGVVGSTKNLLQATHIIVPNEFMAKKQPKSYSIRGIHSGEIAKIGYPRIDVTLNMAEDSKEQIATRLGVDTSKKILLYVPTWRGETRSDNRFDSNKLISDLKMLAELDINVVFRGHTISNRLLKDTKFPKNVILPPPDILTNELLGMADIVISDYSSVFFDFLVTNRPIIHYLYDLDIYIKERGLNLSEEELPGTVAKNSEQLKEAVVSKIQNDKPSNHYLKAKDRFCTYDDGNSTERVVNWFFYNNFHDIQFVDRSNSDKNLYLIGDMSNQIEFSNLINKFEEDKENETISTLLFSNNISKDKDKIGVVSKLSHNINFIVHDKNMPTTLEEAFAIDYFKVNGCFNNEKMKGAYNKAYLREARRIFGDSQFNQVFNCESHSLHYKSLQDSILTVNKSR